MIYLERSRRSAQTTGSGNEAQTKILLDFYYFLVKVRKSGEKVGFCKVLLPVVGTTDEKEKQQL